MKLNFGKTVKLVRASKKIIFLDVRNGLWILDMFFEEIQCKITDEGICGQLTNYRQL